MTDAPTLGPNDLAEAGTILRRLLALVDAGELEATTPTARAVLRRIEGAAIALELATEQTRPPRVASATDQPADAGAG